MSEKLLRNHIINYLPKETIMQDKFWVEHFFILSTSNAGTGKGAETEGMANQKQPNLRPIP